MRQRLADHDGAGFAQQRHAARVSRRTMAQEMRGAHGGGHVGGVDVVLDGHGNAVQRTAHSPRRALGVERARLRQRGGNIRVHEGVELWVEPFDGRAGVAHQILGAECPLGHASRQFSEAATREEARFDRQARRVARGPAHRAAPVCAAPAGRRGATPGRTCSMAIMPMAVAMDAATNITE